MFFLECNVGYNFWYPKNVPGSNSALCFVFSRIDLIWYIYMQSLMADSFHYLAMQLVQSYIAMEF